MTQSGTSTWNGGFVLGDLIDPRTFISESAKITSDGAVLSAMNIEKIIKIGADTLGVGMELNKPITVTVPATANKEYRVITSEDGLNWSNVGSGALVPSGVSGKASFRTQKFSYFALVVPAPVIPPSCSIVASTNQVMNGGSTMLTWTSQNAKSASLATIGNQSLQGSLNVVPPSDTGTSYILTVVGDGNITSSCQVVITAI